MLNGFRNSSKTRSIVSTDDLMSAKVVRVNQRFTIIAAMVLLSSVFAGCGGGSNSLHSPFNGSWRGTWTDTTTTESGNLLVNIVPSGAVSGSVSNATTGGNGIVAGKVSSAGAMVLTYTYPDGSSVTDSGTVILSSSGQITGTLTETQSGTTLGTATVALTNVL